VDAAPLAAGAVRLGHVPHDFEIGAILGQPLHSVAQGVIGPTQPQRNPREIVVHVQQRHRWNRVRPADLQVPLQRGPVLSFALE